MDSRALQEADLAEVLAIESVAQAYPWTRGNFLDALRSGHVCRVLERDGRIAAYAVLLPGVDEAELLLLAVAPEQRRRGLGRMLLGEMLDWARKIGRRRVVLEVRVGNAAAIALYQAAGFSRIGLRRGYYPAANGREDALLMGCEL